MAERYNTRNSRPSNSMKDVNDNALAFDDFMGIETDLFVDRLGHERDSLAGAVKKVFSESSSAVGLATQNLIPLSRQYMSVVAAQADIANIPVGSTTYVRSLDGTSLADEYINNSGSLVPTGRKMPSQKTLDDAVAPLVSLIPLVPLANTAEFFETGVSGTEFEAVTDQNVVTDSANNLIHCLRGGKQVFIVPVWSKEISGEKLVIAGVEIDPNGIPPEILAKNLLGLAEASVFMDAAEFQPGGQYEAVTDKDIRMDGNFEILSCIRDGVNKYFIPVAAKSLSAEEFQIQDSIEYLPAAMFSPGGELEAWSGYSDFKFDQDRSLLSYVKGGKRYELLPLSAPAIDTRSLRIDGVDIREALGIKNTVQIPWEQTDNGKKQIFVFNKVTGTQARITDGTANESSPVINDSGLVEWQSDRDSTVIAGKFFQAGTGKIHPVISRSVICGWGDSFMEQTAMMNKLQALTGLTCFNFGKSGLRSTAVAARQGGEPFWCMPEGGVIPASGPVNLLPNVPGPAASAANGAMTGIKCSLGGVDGTFNWSGTQATFIRDFSGLSVNIPTTLPLFIYPYTTSAVAGSTTGGVLYNQHDEAIVGITCGRNNTTLWTEVVRNISSMVTYLKPLGKRFFICPQFTQSTETKGTDGYQRIYRINAALKELFPHNYVEINGVDLLQNFKNHYNPAYAQDVTDIANDTTPTSLRTDALHPSQVLRPDALYIGGEVNAEFIYQFIKSKGWVN